MSHATKAHRIETNAARRWLCGFVRVVPYAHLETDLRIYRINRQIGAKTWGAINGKDSLGTRWVLLYLGLLTIGFKVNPNKVDMTKRRS